MAIKRSSAKAGFKTAKRRAGRSRAGAVVFFGQALFGDEQARADVKEAVDAGRKAYARTADRRGRPDVAALFSDRRARRHVGTAATSLRRALRTANRKRARPANRRGPVTFGIALASAGGVAAIAKQRRHRATGRDTPADQGMATSVAA